MQPPDGPPICAALNALPSEDAAADVVDDVAERHAHGHLDQAGVVHGPAGEDLGALALLGAEPRSANQSAPFAG
jgi:hypothetical protein